MAEQCVAGTVWAYWIAPSGVGDPTGWIDSHYLPQVATLPGVTLAERLAAPGHDDLVLVWLTAPTAEDDTIADLDGRLRARLGDHVAPESGRYVGRSARGGAFDAPVLLCVRVRVQEGTEQAARDWLDDEHAPRQLEVPGALTFHGFESTRHPHAFLNLWGLADPDVPSSSAWAQQRDTPWMRRFWTTVSTATSDIYTRTVRTPADAAAGSALG